MKLQDSRRIELVELAEEVVGSISPIPGAVDVAGILYKKNIKLHRDHYPEDFDALISYDGAKFHVHLNLRILLGDIYSTRARFSIAHELGHYFIDEHRNQLIAGKAPHPSKCGMFDGADSMEEQEADFFGASIIMPPSRFIPAAFGLGSPMETIRTLADTFDTSLTATALQYTNHVSDRCLVIRWTTEGVLAWSQPGRGYRAEGFRSTLFKTPEKLPKDSATGRVMAGKTTFDDGVLTMANVFQNVALSGVRDTFVTEEAMALGDYGYLTIISDLKPAVPISQRALRRRTKSSS